MRKFLRVVFNPLNYIRMKKVTIAVITDDGKLLVFNKPIDDLKAMNH